MACQGNNTQIQQHFAVRGKIGVPFLGELIIDCLNQTEIAMTQEHTFKAAELCLEAQKKAVVIVG